LNSHTQGLKP